MSKNISPWNRGQRSLKVIGTDTNRSAACDFILMFHSNYGPIFYRFRDKRWLQLKIANFSHPVYFASPLKGFPLELGIGARGQKKLQWWGYRAEQEVWRYLQPWGYNPPTWRTDGRTDRHATTAKTALTHSVARVLKYHNELHMETSCGEFSIFRGLRLYGIGKVAQETHIRFADSAVQLFVSVRTSLSRIGRSRQPYVIMPRPHWAETLSDDARLTSVCRVRRA